jgi:hypothetical protein
LTKSEKIPAIAPPPMAAPGTAAVEFARDEALCVGVARARRGGEA